MSRRAPPRQPPAPGSADDTPSHADARESPGNTLSLRERKKRLARQAILDSAIALIDERGYADTRMRDIATRARLSYQTLYNYFPAKVLILDALLNDRAAHARDALRAVVRHYAGGLPAAIDALHAISLEAITPADRPLWRLAALELHAGGDGPLQPQARALLGQLLLEARGAGELRATVNLGQLTDTLFDLWQHAVLRFVLDPDASTTIVLRRLHLQTALVVSPYLTDPADG